MNYSCLQLFNFIWKSFWIYFHSYWPYLKSLKIFLKCGEYVYKVFGCRLMVFCGDSASIGLFYYFFSLVCKYLFWTYHCIWWWFLGWRHSYWKKVFGIFGGPKKGLKNWWRSSWWCSVPSPQLLSSSPLLSSRHLLSSTSHLHLFLIRNSLKA